MNPFSVETFEKGNDSCKQSLKQSRYISIRF
jgi:hypothetical protein